MDGTRSPPFILSSEKVHLYHALLIALNQMLVKRANCRVFNLGVRLAVLLAACLGPLALADDGLPDIILAGGDSAQTPSEDALGEGFLCIRGRLINEGIECPSLRGEDTKLYTLAGDIGDFGVGDEVCVCGTSGGLSFCMQGTTIAVTSISSSSDKRCST